jgi:glycosyltransferase involved in cell wall biosynthesis
LKKVLFLIRSLNVGGAERQLLTLLQAIDRTRFEPVVVTFYAEGTLIPEFIEHNIQVQSAGKKDRWDIFPFIFRLIRIIRSEKPDVINTYLVAANILAILLKTFLLPARIVISIRYSYFRKEDYDSLTSLLYSIENRIAGWSDLIIINSFIGAELAKKRGIPAGKMVVIPNGIDVEKFHPDASTREKSKQIFGIPENGIVIGIIGRIDPIKGHKTLLMAAKIIDQIMPDTHYLIVGNGEIQLEKDLISFSESLGLKDKVYWIPTQKDLLAVYNALDICVSSSIGEGFSNVIAEAMACGIPCVVTDVGDSANIVGQTGEIIPIENANKLADALFELAKKGVDERQELGRQTRERIIAMFSVEKMVNSTMQEFEKLG